LSAILECNAVIPVGIEVGDLKVCEDGIEPCQHELLGRHLAPPDLVAQDQMPDQCQDQLEVAIHYVYTTCKHTHRCGHR